MSAKQPPLSFVPSSSFVFRTPLLPLATFIDWSTGMSAAAADPAALTAALADDCTRLRQRLADILARPQVRDAIYVASPDLAASFSHWVKEPDSPRGHKVERALVRYFSRMSARATPFGLFSGVSPGLVGDQTDLTLAGDATYERHTRLDNDYLFALCEALGRDPAIRAALTYKVNSSLYTAAGRLRYAEARLVGKLRSHHLVAVEPTDYLAATLDRARAGATRAELAAALVADDAEIERAEADEFIDELIDSQILVSDLSPAVTGDEPIHGLIAELEAMPAAASVAAQLGAAQGRIEAIDAAGLGASADDYGAVAADLESLPTKVELSRLFQVDMVKPSPAATLGGPLLFELQRGIDVLQRMTSGRGESQISRFRDAFTTRYEDREVDLVEALDEEVGIGFEAARGPSSEASPLLAGLAFPAVGGGDNQTSWGRREVFLARRLLDLTARGERELTLSDADIKLLSVREPALIPDAFSVIAEVAASSPAALASGDFRLLLEGGGGPSGARISGRFCHASAAIHAGVIDHLRSEEALRPAAVFAEIAHLPEGRIGNILCRPVLRDYEIPYLGLSGAPPERQLPIGDLTVAVAAGRVVLRSRQLDREVIPRLTTAHNYSLRSLGVYRFLCALQSQSVSSFGWSWGANDNATFLPRVRYGRLVFARARWLLIDDDLEPLRKANGKAKAKSPADIRARRQRIFTAATELRRRRDLPRRVLLVDGDNELLVDFDNALSVDSFAQLIKSRPQATISEEFAAPDELVTHGPEGSFACQLSTAFVATRAAIRSALAPAIAAPARRFGPGSEWLYAKLYTGTSTADEVIRQLVTPVARQALQSGAADHWFFIRYGDPDWHLRVRWHGDPRRLHQEVAPLLLGASNALLEDGLLWRVQLDTYEREMERYGGAVGIDLAERMFAVDSDAVAAIVDLLSGDAGMDARWRLVLRGADMLLDDLGLDLAAKHQLMKRARDSMGREFGADAGFGKQLGAKFRKERQALFAMLARDPAADAASELAPGFEVLAERSLALAPIVAELREREQAGELTSPIEEMAWSYVHMHANRLLRSVARAQELVIYDFLKRYYDSLVARARTGKR